VPGAVAAEALSAVLDGHALVVAGGRGAEFEPEAHFVPLHPAPGNDGIPGAARDVPDDRAVPALVELHDPETQVVSRLDDPRARDVRRGEAVQHRPGLVEAFHDQRVRVRIERPGQEPGKEHR